MWVAVHLLNLTTVKIRTHVHAKSAEGKIGWKVKEESKKKIWNTTEMQKVELEEE